MAKPLPRTCDGRARRPDTCWPLDEVFVSVSDKRMYMWRAVDAEAEVLDILLRPRRDRKAALKLMRKLLKKQGSSRMRW